MPRPVREVVVVGRDVDAWLAALGLVRAVGRLGVTIRVLELPTKLGPHHVTPALPALAGLHDLLGLRPSALYRECRAVPSLGTRFVGWSGPEPFLLAYDVARPAIDDIDFLQFWVDARARGLRVPLEEFSVAAVAAKQGRMDDAPVQPDRLGGFTPGMHMDATRYAGLLRRGAVAAGVAAIPAEVVEVEREGEAIRAMVTDAGERVAGDLFIDASGADGALISGQPGAAWEDWSAWLSADRLFTGSLPPLRPLPGFAQATACPDGWVGLFPLQDRTALVACVAARGRDDAELARAIEAVAGRSVAGLTASPLRAGAQARPWIGNCVAVGGAAAGLEPLDAGAPHLAQITLSNLVALWPADADEPVEAAPYAAAVASHLGGVRDFTIAHYRLNARRGEALWDGTRAAAPPPGLAAKLSLFGARGQVPMFDDESFAEQLWSASFVGHGLVPRSVDPRVDGVPLEERIGKAQALLHAVADAVRAMPEVQPFIAARTGA